VSLQQEFARVKDIVSGFTEHVESLASVVGKAQQAAVLFTTGVDGKASQLTDTMQVLGDSMIQPTDSTDRHNDARYQQGSQLNEALTLSHSRTSDPL